MAETPESDRLLKLREDGISPAIEDFMDWLGVQGLQLMRYRDTIDDRMCITCAGNGHLNSANPDPLAGWSTTVPEVIQITCEACLGKGYQPIVIGQDWYADHRSTQNLLYDYLGINKEELERERRDMLDELRMMNAKTAE